ncbi:MAG: hypothetical protein FJ167_01210 [Gammaproteobacteria bacterium]|nr:hypothetical protein [Gammaproteobacteria bacterium]MBM4223420.1 hypothetical protein [Gammaproteobacteria bacterium]
MLQYAWKVATVIASAAAIYLFIVGRVPGCDAHDGGAVLHLVRLDVDTVRAKFCHSQDCELIAEQMNKVERARWHCKGDRPPDLGNDLG